MMRAMDNQSDQIIAGFKALQVLPLEAKIRKFMKDNRIIENRRLAWFARACDVPQSWLWRMAHGHSHGITLKSIERLVKIQEHINQIEGDRKNGG